jgi:hypothetical protein
VSITVASATFSPRSDHFWAWAMTSLMQLIVLMPHTLVPW